VLPGASSPRGHAYTESEINTALANPSNPNLVLEKDIDGHGTHVAGTAAGNGNAGNSPGTFSGMAPEADLVVVKATRDDDGSFSSTDIINALAFVQQRAADLNEPFVINLSLGGHLGPHDGTDPEERAIDNIVNSGTGRASAWRRATTSKLGFMRKVIWETGRIAPSISSHRFRHAAVYDPLLSQQRSDQHKYHYSRRANGTERRFVRPGGKSCQQSVCRRL